MLTDGGFLLRLAHAVSPLFPDIIPLLAIPILEIKKSEKSPNVSTITLTIIVVYLFLMSYGRAKHEQLQLVMPNFLQVSSS